VGNDFLPHSPSLHIREGAIDAILAIYKQQLPALGDYLTLNGIIEFNRVDIILNDISKIEEEFIKSKRAYEDKQKAFAAQTSNGSSRGSGFQRPNNNYSRSQANTSS
jgi:5'-3' exoribonuclease 2